MTITHRLPTNHTTYIHITANETRETNGQRGARTKKTPHVSSQRSGDWLQHAGQRVGHEAPRKVAFSPSRDQPERLRSRYKRILLINFTPRKFRIGKAGGNRNYMPADDAVCVRLWAGEAGLVYGSPARLHLALSLDFSTLASCFPQYAIVVKWKPPRS